MAKPILKMYDNEKTYQELFEDYITLIKIQGMAEGIEKMLVSTGDIFNFS